MIRLNRKYLEETLIRLKQKLLNCNFVIKGMNKRIRERNNHIIGNWTL